MCLYPGYGIIFPSFLILESFIRTQGLFLYLDLFDKGPLEPEPL